MQILNAVLLFIDEFYNLLKLLFYVSEGNAWMEQLRQQNRVLFFPYTYPVSVLLLLVTLRWDVECDKISIPQREWWEFQVKIPFFQ